MSLVSPRKASELLSGAAKLSARGKEELVTLVANEVRNYIEKLRLGEELESFLETHELQINVKLQPRPRPPNPDAAPPDEGEAGSESNE